MPTNSAQYIRIGLPDDLLPTIPPGDDPDAASAIAEFALAQQTVFANKLRRFLSGHEEVAPTTTAHARDLADWTRMGLLEWARQWPTDAVEASPEFDVTQQDALAASELAEDKSTGSGLAVPDGDDPETVYEITAFVFQGFRELRAEIDIFANGQYVAAPASAEHAWELSTGYLRVLIFWAVNSWPG